MGDFNSIVYTKGRIGGDAVTDRDVQEFTSFLNQTGLCEMRNIGAYYSWSNKTIWSRIDRSLINTLWHATFDFTQMHYLANSLLDHTPLLLHFPTSPNQSTFSDTVIYGTPILILKEYLKRWLTTILVTAPSLN